MHDLLENLLICPFDREISLQKLSQNYFCAKCKRNFPITNGIPTFLDEKTIPHRQKDVSRSFGYLHSNYQRSRYLRPAKETIQDWLNIVQLPADYFKDKLVLDAGCGAGRWTYALANLGARVVAVDIAHGSVESTKAITRDFHNVAVIQASIFQLPFKQNVFDFIVSWGVLHHTPNTKQAFSHLPPLLKPGGSLHLMVYEKYQPIRVIGTNVLRFFLQKLPDEKLYDACRHLIFRNRVVYILLSPLIACTYQGAGENLDCSTLQYGLYDAYSPRYNWLHTSDEVENWFKEYGFSDLVMTSPLIQYKVLGIFAKNCYGSINMRGFLPNE